jgi:predicted dinucleotide-utilizing enzyme
MGADRGLISDAIAFCARDPDTASAEVRVNFGVFAGRNATQAEIDDLARIVQQEVESFSIVAAERHEFGDASEASVRQVVIEVGNAADDALCDRIVKLAEQWAADSIRARSDLGELGSEL